MPKDEIDLLADDASVRPIRVPAGSRQLSGRVVQPKGGRPRGLVVALHGGSYTSRYFDSRGHSALAALARLGYAAVALDRPGYGEAQDWTLGFDAQVEVLVPTISRIWREHGEASSGVLLYGHSIGGMISLLIGGAKRDFPLLGLSMTGAGAVFREQALGAFSGALQAPTPHVDIPYEGKLALMFGPDWTHDAATVAKDAERDVPLAIAELRDALAWQERLPAAAAAADVPVHFVVGEYDGIWHGEAEKLSGVKALFGRAPFVDVYTQRQSGHDVELDHMGFGHVLKVAAFFEECRLRARQAS